MKTTYDTVKQILEQRLGVSPKDPNASVTDDLGADSLDLIDLVVDFEDEFDIDIPDEDAEKIRTVQDIVDYLERQMDYYDDRGPLQ